MLTLRFVMTQAAAGTEKKNLTLAQTASEHNVPVVSLLKIFRRAARGLDAPFCDAAPEMQLHDERRPIDDCAVGG